jgi:hypothetical protein
MPLSVYDALAQVAVSQPGSLRLMRPAEERLDRRLVAAVGEVAVLAILKDELRELEAVAMGPDRERGDPPTVGPHRAAVEVVPARAVADAAPTDGVGDVHRRDEVAGGVLEPGHDLDLGRRLGVDLDHPALSLGGRGGRHEGGAGAGEEDGGEGPEAHRP